MTHKLLVGTNTKMYKNIRQTCEYLEKLIDFTADIPNEQLQIFVIPSFTALAEADRIIQGSNLLLGAQNMCWEDEGQFTGEISPLMLKEVGVNIIEIAHSERRHIFHEDDAMANRKVHTALRHGFTPLLCVGETLEDKNAGQSDNVLQTQIKKGLDGISPEEAGHIWIAYEPVWAIGVNGLPASSAYAGEKHQTIRTALTDLFGNQGNAIPILYGGSVNNQNAAELLSMPEINGLFIGRSAWDAENFNAMIRALLPIQQEKPISK